MQLGSGLGFGLELRLQDAAILNGSNEVYQSLKTGVSVSEDGPL